MKRKQLGVLSYLVAYALMIGGFAGLAAQKTSPDTSAFHSYNGGFTKSY